MCIFNIAFAVITFIAGIAFGDYVGRRIWKWYKK